MLSASRFAVTMLLYSILIVFVFIHCSLLQSCSAATTSKKTDHKKKPDLFDTIDVTNSSSHRFFKSGQFSTSNPRAVETMMVYREQEVFQQAFQLARAEGYSIQGFYHTSIWQPRWKDVILEQLLLLDGRRRFPKQLLQPDSKYAWDNKWWTSLLAASENLYLNVAGSSKSDYEKVLELVNIAGLMSRQKITVGYNKTIGRMEYRNAKPEQRQILDKSQFLSSGEFSTVDMLQKYCNAKTEKGEKALVYYMHSKSTCCYKEFDSTEENPRASWRELMNAFNIEFPSICLRALLKGYNTCGVENQDAHYSGNFWWANCEHISALQQQTARYDPWSVEFFVQRYSVDGGFAKKIGFHCGYSMYNCGVNLYDKDCKREWYRGKILKMVMGKIGPSNRGRPHGHNETEVCSRIRGGGKVLYSDNQKYMREEFKNIKSAR